MASTTATAAATAAAAAALASASSLSFFSMLSFSAAAVVGVGAVTVLVPFFRLLSVVAAYSFSGGVLFGGEPALPLHVRYILGHDFQRAVSFLCLKTQPLTGAPPMSSIHTTFVVWLALVLALVS